MKKTRRNQVKEEALALELPVDPLQMCVLPIISELAEGRITHTCICLTHTHTFSNQLAAKQRGRLFFFKSERRERKKKRQKGDYNLIRSRKSWSNPAGGAEMPPCCRLLDYRRAGFHLNRLLQER